MPIDTNKFSKLNKKKKITPKTETVDTTPKTKVSQGFVVGQQSSSTERTTLVLNSHDLELLESNTLKIRRALKRRGISRSTVARAAISYFNKLSLEQQIELVDI